MLELTIIVRRSACCFGCEIIHNSHTQGILKDPKMISIFKSVVAPPHTNIRLLNLTADAALEISLLRFMLVCECWHRGEGILVYLNHTSIFYFKKKPCIYIPDKVEVPSISDKVSEVRLQWFGHVRRRQMTTLAHLRGVRPWRTWDEQLRLDMETLNLSEDMADMTSNRSLEFLEMPNYGSKFL